ncbi:MAG: site-specific integrase [Oscillospiraceae bacterium]|nr:site-specific integrase [Oscillospiraceae bacterium]
MKLPSNTTESKGKKLANEFAVEFEQKCRGYSTLNENMRFSELADWYFSSYAPVELKESTTYNYKSQYDNHLAPVIGNMKLKDITTPKITEIKQSYKLNSNTVKKIYVVLQSIFSRGVEQGLYAILPVNTLFFQNVTERKSRYSTRNKAKAFLTLLETKAWENNSKNIIKVLLYTGMRSGECLGLS